MALCLAFPSFGQSSDTGTGGGSSLPARDSLLVGRWVAIRSHDEAGNFRPESFEVEYRNDGKAIFNRKALYEKFNKQRIRLGYAALSLPDFNRIFPRVTWTSRDNRIVLTFRSSLGTNDLSYHYNITGDTLTTVNESLTGTLSKLVAVRNR